jgi:hypothetical protein
MFTPLSPILSDLHILSAFIPKKKIILTVKVSLTGKTSGDIRSSLFSVADVLILWFLYKEVYVSLSLPIPNTDLCIIFCG